jgi:hypothetical protein
MFSALDLVDNHRLYTEWKTRKNSDVHGRQCLTLVDMIETSRSLDLQKVDADYH